MAPGNVARDELGVVDDHALLQLLGARAPSPKQLDEDFAHVAIRLSQDRGAFGIGLFRKRARDVPRGEIAPPAQQMKRDKIDPARDTIEHGQRQPTESAQEEDHRMWREGVLRGAGWRTSSSRARGK